MSRVRKWLGRVAEKLAGNYYEGPEPPARFNAMVAKFAEAHPNATRGQWARFAMLHAQEAYRSAYTRGWECTERDFADPPTPPELIADALDPSWRDKRYDWQWGGGITWVGEDESPVRVVDEEESPASIAAQLERARRIRRD